jgi:hypothetical protein
MSKTGGGAGTNQYAVQGVSQANRQDTAVLDGLAGNPSTPPEVPAEMADSNTDAPTIEDLEDWMEKGGCETPDGCWVEPDGHCEHGQQSWLLMLGMI